jgi:hypothetical protein
MAAILHDKITRLPVGATLAARFDAAASRISIAEQELTWHGPCFFAPTGVN